MSLQVINSTKGQPEYVLLPIHIYRELQAEIDKHLQAKESEYEPFVLEDYMHNPVALARIKANVTQEALAALLNVSQAYISKIERQKSVTAKTLDKINKALKKLTKTDSL